MPSARLQEKTKYFHKLINLIETHPNILIVDADYVGSRQLQEIRIELRGRAVILMGKNTMIRTCLRQNKDKYPHLGLDKLIGSIKGNIGFIFCIDPIADVRKVITENKVPAAAKAGVISSADVKIPAGPTGLDPSSTNFFQALNIATKIVKGTIELVSEVSILKIGQKVSLSEQILLQKLNIQPFFYSLRLLQVYQSGVVFDAAVLDITDDVLMQKWSVAVSNVAAFSRKIGIPTSASLPHMMSAGFKNVVALALGTDLSFTEVDKIRDLLANPTAFVTPATAEQAAPAAVAAPVVEEEEEEEEMDFDLFG